MREIARVLRPQGTAVISVYYKNLFLRSWPVIKPVGKLLSMLGAGLKGRGREGIYSRDQVDEIVRLFDGDNNPIGKAYSQRSLIQMLSPYFQVERTFLHFFPARSLPFSIPSWLHRILQRNLGFLILAICRKTS